MRTAANVEQTKESRTDGTQPSAKGRHKRATAHLVPWQWKPGQTGNPGGKPKVDVARIIAQAIFENNAEAAYAGLGKALAQGNAYVFKELADRGYGKMTEKLDMNVSSDVVERLNSARKRKPKA